MKRFLLLLLFVAPAAWADGPCATGCSGKTALKCATDGLGAQQWCEFSTPPTHAIMSGCSITSPSTITETDSWVWDSARNQVHYFGSPHEGNAKEITYDEATNTWSAINRQSAPPGNGCLRVCQGGSNPGASCTSDSNCTDGVCSTANCSDPPDTPGYVECTNTQHGYEMNAADPVTGDWFVKGYFNGIVERWNGSSWSSLPVENLCSNTVNRALSYFPERDGLFMNCRGDTPQVAFWNRTANTWTGLTETGCSIANSTTTISPWSEYDHKNKLVWFGGRFGTGATTSIGTDTCAYLADGTFTQEADALHPMGPQGSLIANDPVGGGFVVMNECAFLNFPNGCSGTGSNSCRSGTPDTQRWRHYNPITNTWTNITWSMPPITLSEPPVGGFASCSTDNVNVVLHEHDAIMFIQHNGASASSVGTPRVFLYRHSSPVAECADGVDNDGDGETDFNNSTCTPSTENCDLDCYSATDPSEDPCSDGSAYCEAYCAANPTTAIRCIGFEDDAMVRRFAYPITGGHCLNTEPGTGNKCFGSFSDGGGTEGSSNAMRLETLLSQIDRVNGGTPSQNFSVQFRDDNSVQFDVGTDFWVRWDQRMNQSYLDHLIPKQIYINQGDTTNWWDCVPTSRPAPLCSGSCTDMEIVVQEGTQNGGPDKMNWYHGCPGPYGNKGASYFDNTTADGNPSCGNNRIQHVEGYGGEMCCFSGTQTDCVQNVANTWIRYWMHVTVGPSWAAADDRIQMYAQRSGTDSTRILVYDTDISKNFGDAFAGRINNCGTCSNNPTVGCMVDGECPGGTCTNREFGCGGGLQASGSAKYGKIWINAYTAPTTGLPDPTAGEIAYTWYDNLIISRTDPEGPIIIDPPSTPSGMTGIRLENGAAIRQ